MRPLALPRPAIVYFQRRRPADVPDCWNMMITQITIRRLLVVVFATHFRPD
jgi:hypothetical protein